MTAAGWLQLAVFLALITLSTPLMGGYMDRVYRGGPAPGDRLFLVVERRIYSMVGVDPDGDQRWTEYAAGLLIFSLFGIIVVYVILRLQGHLPFNHDHLPGLPPALAFNTAISFATTTDWTSYTAETTVSTFAQMVALVGQMFMAAAVGMAVLVALIRGITRRRSTGMGSFWVNTTRSIVRILLPLSFVFAVVLMSQGVIEGFTGPAPISTLAAHGHATMSQTIPTGPVATQDAPELLGNNGGGFFAANLAHPFENPSPVTNLLLTWLTVMIPFAFCWTFGRMVGSLRQGVALLTSMLILFVTPLAIMWPLEAHGNAYFERAGVDQAAGSGQSGGNLEGKEVRFGTAESTLTTMAETPTTSGAPDSALESYLPLSGPEVDAGDGDVLGATIT